MMEELKPVDKQTNIDWLAVLVNVDNIVYQAFSFETGHFWPI